MTEEQSTTPSATSLLTDIEGILSIPSLASHPEYLGELDEEGYLPLSYLEKSIGRSYQEIVEFLGDCPEYSLNEDQTRVRLHLPIERKTIILRDVPEDMTEQEIRDLIPQWEVVNLRQEVANSWFLQFATEEITLQVIAYLQQATLRGEMIKARVKSEFYKRELLKQIAACKPTRKLSSDAHPFVSAEHKLSSEAAPFCPVAGSVAWGSIGLPNGMDFGYYGSYQPSVPVVITSCSDSGYKTDFVKYTKEELFEIVKGVTDCSLPEMDSATRELDVIEEAANVELVGKGRTMSIDQALRSAAPRTWSVDSIDYSNMVLGSMDEETASVLRKRRRQHKKHHHH